MTDDGIRIERPAVFGRRLVASLVDVVIVYAGTTVLEAVAGGGLRLGGWTTSLVLQTAYFWILTGILGRTPGKIALRIELHHPSGRIGPGVAFLREVVGKAVASVPFFLGFLWIAFDPQKRGWHDMIAGTRAVVVERITWQAEWDDRILGWLAGGTTVTAAMLEDVPEPWRPAILSEFGRRHPDLASMEPGTLRPPALTEVF